MVERQDIRALVDQADQAFGHKDAFRTLQDGTIISTTFHEVRCHRDELGEVLYHRGLQGAHIAVAGSNSVQWAIAYVTAACAGVVVPMPVELPAEMVAPVVEKAEITVVIAEDSLLNGYPDHLVKIGFSELPALYEEGRRYLDAGAHQFSEAPIDPEATCELLMTSGTTGARKLVELSHTNMLTIATSTYTKRWIGCTATVSVLPLSHGFECVCHMLSTFHTGGAVCFIPSIRWYARSLNIFQAESIFLVPAMVQGLLARFPDELEKARGTLKVIVCGGAPLDPMLGKAMKAYGVRLLNGYGLSECSPLVSLDEDDVEGSVGVPAPFLRVRISECNEVEIKGTNVMKGYYNDPVATQAVFTEDGWFKTGDLGRLDASGNLFLTGRVKNLIILSNGENVSPEEVESLLKARVPAIVEALAFAQAGGIAVRIYCGDTPTDEQKQSMIEQVKTANRTLPTTMRVNEIIITDEPLPRNATGKLIR